MKTIWASVIWVAGGAVLSSSVWADSFSADVALDVRSEQNANLASEESAEREEVQSRLKLLLNGVVEGTWSRLDSDLKVESRTYSEESDLNNVVALGEIDWVLGKASFPLGLELGYYSQELLQDPAAGNTASNLDSRQIYSVGVPFTMRLSAINRVRIKAEAEAIRYDVYDINSSDRATLSAGYTRIARRNLNLSLDLTATHSEFTESGLESEYRRAAIGFNGRQPNFNYTVALGINEQEFGSAEPQTSPYASIQVGDSSASLGWFVRALQQLTDTSAGGSRSLNFGIDQNGQLGVQAQYEVRDIRAGVSLPSLCEACEFKLEVGHVTEDYINNDNQDSEQLLANIYTAYTSHRDFTLYALARISEVDRPENDGWPSYSDTDGQVGVKFNQLFQRLSARLYVGVETRNYDSELIGDYDNPKIGVELSMNLYRR